MALYCRRGMQAGIGTSGCSLGCGLGDGRGADGVAEEGPGDGLGADAVVEEGPPLKFST